MHDGSNPKKKSRLKSELAYCQSSSLFRFQLTFFVKCRRTLLELNSQLLYPSSEREKKIVVARLRPPQMVKLSIFTTKSFKECKDM